MQDDARTLDELERINCGDAPPKASYLVATLHALRKKPISQFTNEDLRICIGQEIGLPWLMPRALSTLEHDPLTAGDFYEGDLLLVVVRACGSISHNRELITRVGQVVRRARTLLIARPDLEFVLSKLEREWRD